MTIAIDDSFIQAHAESAVKKALEQAINSSPAVSKAIELAISKIMVDVTPHLKDAVDNAVIAVTTRPDFLHALIEKAIMDSSNKLTGAFDASMKAAGKALALDRSTLTALTEEVKARIAAEQEEKGIGAFS